ncbi:flagellar biosynthetic protein FliO [Alkalilimnicola sp. S0819]|nr:flagellar biosynthetic protein FliO [Alkalilimnicola sp. S0819]MPQ15885.1 flagellar biosynthetic protein FliO [Alkalilimnicola sp. S0819]
MKQQRRINRAVNRADAVPRLGRRFSAAALGLLTLPTLAAAQQAPGAGVDSGALLRLTGGLVLVVLAILALSWLLKRSGRFAAPGGGQLRALASVQVGQRERVVLLKVGEQQLLVGVAPGQVRTLHVLDQPLEGLEPKAAEKAMSPFAQRLHRVMQQHEKRP